MAGCVGTPAPPIHENPSLALLGEGDCPLVLRVRLTNNDDGSITVAASGFRVVDNNGTVGPLNAPDTFSLSPDNFPVSLTLAPNESVEGILVFSTNTENHPYTLKYDHGGFAAEVGLNTPPAGTDGCGSAPPPPTPTISLAIGTWSGLATVASITSVSSASIDPTTLVYQVVAGNGTIYFSGASGTGAAVNGVVITITYNEAGGSGANYVGPDDNIGISVAQSSDLVQVHGTTFKVLQGSTVLGTAGVP